MTSLLETSGTGYIFAGCVILVAWGAGTYSGAWPSRIRRYEEYGAHEVADSARRWVRKMGRVYFVVGVLFIVGEIVQLVVGAVT